MASSDRAAASGPDPASLRVQIRQITEQTNRLSRPASQRRKYHRVFGYTKIAATSVVAVYVLSEYDISMAAQKLLTLPRVGYPSPSCQLAERLAEDMFLAMADDDHFIGSLFDPCGSAARRLVSSAKRFIAEARTYRWVARQNESHGVAPHSLQARAEFNRLLGTGNGSSSSVKSARQWVRRWKRRWGVTRGKLRQQEPVTAETIKEKATWSGLFMTTRLFFSVCFSHRLGFSFPARFPGWVSNTVQRHGPKNRTGFRAGFPALFLEDLLYKFGRVV